MIVLGLSVAHDAGVTAIADGVTLGVHLRERFARRKRCALMTAETIEAALVRFGLDWNDVDAVAVASTQSWPFIFVDPDAFSFALADPTHDTLGFTPREQRAQARAQEWYRQRQSAAARRAGRIAGIRWNEYLDDDLGTIDPDRGVLANFEWSYTPPWWTRRFARTDVTEWARKVDELREVRFGYQPIEVGLRGVKKPGVIVPHHLAHAALAYYQSDAESAAVYTIDNGDAWSPEPGYVGGLFALGQGNRIIPIGPNYAYHGHLYQRTAEIFHLGHGGGAGKLMGLAPFGEPRFNKPDFVGNAYEIFGDDYAAGHKPDRFTVLDKFEAHTRAVVASGYPDPDAMLASHEPGAYGSQHLRRLEVDVAASAQALFEACTLNDVNTLSTALQEAGQRVGTLALGGGGALNCPTNSRVHADGPYGRVFVPPACDDSGLSQGAALALLHDVMDQPRTPFHSDSAGLAYQGSQYSQEAIADAVSACGSAVRARSLPDPAAEAANDLASGRVIGWFEGRSEIGPRALGHRSILADPRPETQWRRVNDLKSREHWRPFAPAVLREHAAEWFEGAPTPSPFMLFTAQVRSRAVPAITHVDGSSRIQTVDASCGVFHGVLDHFHRRTGIPLVMNTSFNGPAEPIVESPSDALRFLQESQLDAVYLDGLRVTRGDAAD
ncbi:hypothetical protein GCM10017083_18700 [Thalassobaculum fulvum]|uniref:Carbamoyltransferase n=1 Tax=Thalassobaculum fulvum TaxID=1633335 RepID=A0A918XQT4_9PROT|nr:carbamoyltransferase C-terminal domain-containing protein [Thalassobaculum fulvum]GHD47843.1 hypothetical protein GCM10017083_18700 [Thalassobaculum fulvum]